jgi:hypothetical protein
MTDEGRHYKRSAASSRAMKASIIAQTNMAVALFIPTLLRAIIQFSNVA